MKKRPIEFNYSLGNVNLLKANAVNDLYSWGKFDYKHSFNDHINSISNKAGATKLGFLKRTWVLRF